MFTLDRSTAAGILHSCAKKKDLSEGKRIHSLLLSSGQDDDARLGNLLITMYGKCGEITQAREVFHKLTHKNTRSWNVMIAAYAQNGHMLEAVELFNRMSQEGLEPDNYTYSAVLSVYTKALDVSNGRRVHERASTLGYASDAITASALVHLYGKCGSLEVARDVFEESVVREADAVGLWTSMMAAYSEHDRNSDAMRVYSRMLLEGVRPDPHTYVTVLNVCIALRDLKHGKGVHSCVKSQGLDSDPILATALLNMYGKCNSLGDASETFETLQRKDLICWNAMLAAYTQNDQGGEAFRLFHRMLQEGVKLDKFTLTTMVVCLSTLQEVEFMSSILKENPAIERSSLVLGNTLITMYGKHRRIDGCKSTFDRMNNRNVITWTSLIGAYVENGLFLEALLLYYNMNLEGFKPNEITYVSVLDACFNSGDLRQGRAVHAAIVSSCVELDCFLETAIVNMYGKCGSLETARKVFEQMHEMDIVTWTSIIGSHAQHGRGQEAMEFFHRMELQGVIPNSVTFVIFISACSHAGLVEEALVYFSSMIGDYSIPPEEQHCLCIVDLLARSGRVEEAERFVEKMPFKAQSVAWTTLLTACKVTGTGTNVAKDLFRNGQESGKCGPYVTLATTLKSQLVYECQTTNHVNL